AFRCVGPGCHGCCDDASTREPPYHLNAGGQDEITTPHGRDRGACAWNERLRTQDRRPHGRQSRNRYREPADVSRAARPGAPPRPRRSSTSRGGTTGTRGGPAGGAAGDLPTSPSTRRGV